MTRHTQAMVLKQSVVSSMGKVLFWRKNKETSAHMKYLSLKMSFESNNALKISSLFFVLLGQNVLPPGGDGGHLQSVVQV